MNRVHEDHRGVAILVGEVERERHELVALLHAPGREREELVVAVAAAFDRLEVVRLAGQCVAEPRPAALDVDDHAGQLARGDIGDSLLLEADAGAGGRCHHPLARARRAVDHVDRRDLAFGLKEDSAVCGHQHGHIFGDLVLRRDRVAEERVAPTGDGAVADRLITFHELSFCHRLSPDLDGDVRADSRADGAARASVTFRRSCAGR